jgi:hypothetical protein
MSNTLILCNLFFGSSLENTSSTSETMQNNFIIIMADSLINPLSWHTLPLMSKVVWH